MVSGGGDMSRWIRLDANAWTHPKWQRIPVRRRMSAHGMWCCLLQQASQADRGGVVGHITAPFGSKQSTAESLAGLLVEADLLQHSCDNGYYFRDWSMYQMPRQSAPANPAEDDQTPSQSPTSPQPVPNRDRTRTEPVPNQETELNNLGHFRITRYET